MQSNTSIPCITIRQHWIACYGIWDGDRRKQPNRPKSNKATSGLSNKAKQRLTIAIELLASAAQTKRLYWHEEKRYISYKLNFVTLTLPSSQIHTDGQIQLQILKPFLRWWRDRNPSLLYIWKAEVQDNGNIHFHITSNSFIHHQVLRRHWNKNCERLGYISRSVSNNPNSTDVHALKSIKNISAYLAAYVTKKDTYTKALRRYHKIHGKALKSDNSAAFQLPKNYLIQLKRKVTCKVWDASKLLLEGPCRIYAIAPRQDWELRQIKETGGTVIDLERCRIYERNKASHHQTLSINDAYNDHIKDIRRKCKEVTAILL